MIQLPSGLSTGLALAIACVGVALWLSGAVWSRSLITLILVALGTWIGIRLPGWCGWRIDRMGPAIGGALMLGTAGYVLHRWWIGLAVGWTCSVIFLGIAAPVWVMTHRSQEWSLADAQQLDAPREQVSVLADSTLSAASSIADGADHRFDRGLYALAEQLIRVPMIQFMLGAAGVGFLIGLMMAVRWPRLSASLVWSNVGLCIAGTMGLGLISRRHPEWLVQTLTSCPLVALGPFVLIATGAAVQFFLAGRGNASAKLAIDDDGEE